jgi:hypothetical protein
MDAKPPIALPTPEFLLLLLSRLSPGNVWILSFFLSRLPFFAYFPFFLASNANNSQQEIF